VAQTTAQAVAAPQLARRVGPNFAAMAYGTGSADSGAVSARTAAVAPAGESTSSGMPSNTSDGSKTDSSATPAVVDVASTAASSSAFAATASAAASALSAATAVQGAATRAAAETIIGSRPPLDLAVAADKIMAQVLQTVHTFTTSSGPALEARVNDPNLGDIRMIVTGRAGEIVQAQLVVRDRVTADAIAAAATRMRSAGDGLAGVSLTVRSEGGGSATSGRSGSNAFESAGWTAGSGYGAGAGAGSNPGHGQGLAEQASLASGNGSGGQPGAGQASREATKPAQLIQTTTSREPLSTPRVPLAGGSSLDIRA
jgi:hypothetical protein